LWIVSVNTATQGLSSQLKLPVRNQQLDIYTTEGPVRNQQLDI